MAQAQRDSKRARVPTWKAQAAFDEGTAGGEADDTPEVVHAMPAPQPTASAATAKSQAPDSEPPEDSTAAAAFPLAQLPRDLLPQVLSHLDSPDLLRLSQVSSSFAAACDECFKARCAEHGWRFPRLPRGETAVHKQYPWRLLYRQHACRACGNVGDFPCRRGLGLLRGNCCLFLLCKRCTQLPHVQRHLTADSLHVDLFGLSGQKLLKVGAKKKQASVQHRRRVG